MPAIHEDHAHPQFANDLLVKDFQSLVLVKSNKETVKLKIKINSANPVFCLYAGLIVFDGEPQLVGDFGIRLTRGEHGWNLEHATQMIYLLQIAQGKLRDHHAAMEVAAEQALPGENAKSLPHRIARDAEGSGQRKFLQWSTGPKFAIEDTLAEDGSD